MKKLLLVLVAGLILSVQAFAVNSENWKSEINKNPDLKELSLIASQMSLDEFLHLTPKQFKEITGERMGIKNVVALKAAQKMIKKDLKKDADISKGVYILLAFLGLGWLAMGLLSDWDGSDWIVNLVLTVLCWLPGFIHALVKMDDYY